MDKAIGKKTSYLITAMLFLLLFVIGTKIDESVDGIYWEKWVPHLYKNGLANAYDLPGNDYMPITQIIFYLYGQLMGNMVAIMKHLNYIKIAPLFFDFLGVWYIYKYINKRVAFISILTVCMLNLGYLYNTLIWFQFDGILSTLNFIAIYYAARGKMTKACAFYAMAFNMKVQTIILLPVIGVFYLYYIAKKKSWQSAVYPVLAMLGIQVLFLLPFMFSDGGLSQVWYVITSSVDRYPSVSVNAYNIWVFLLYGQDATQIADSTTYIAGMTYKTIGLLMFFISSFVVLYPLLKQFMLSIKNKAVELVTPDKLLLVCGLLYQCFYLFNTQMHERYNHPAMIFFAAYGFYTRKYLLFILFSVVYFLTLEDVMHWISSVFIDRITSTEFLVVLNIAIFGYGVFRLYKKEKADYLIL